MMYERTLIETIELATDRPKELEATFATCMEAYDSWVTMR